MLLSKTCMYGIRAALYISSNGDPETFVSIRNISQQLNISFHFLTKILQILTQNKLMVSYRGPNGGVSLARPASEITIYEIVAAIDGDKLFTSCIIGLPGCGDLTPCPLHEEWRVIREQIEYIFRNTTLAEMAEKIKQQGLRISEK